MSNHLYHDTAKRLAPAACVLALLLAACGGGGRDNAACGDGVCDDSESATSCATDCGCGNGVVNPGEDCDGADLGGGTCMDAVQRGGTLRCNADCTFDVSGCTLASCGNGIAEDGEACDGADLRDRSCSDVGFVGGDLACKTDCVYDVASCCMDTCPMAGVSECLGDVLRECAPGPSGCLAWQVTDCAAADEICDDSAAPTCTCVDRCTQGDGRCAGASIETCEETAAGCLDWVVTTDCSPNNGICSVAPTGPICAPDVSAEDCTDPYVLSPGDNAVAWTAVEADYLTSASCESSMVGPDLVLSYTAPENGFVRIAMSKPTQRQTMVVSSAACGTVTPELACSSDTAATLSAELGVTMGTTYYVYVRDTSVGTAPLSNPLFVTVEETPCSAIGSVTPTLFPPSGSSVPDAAPVLSVELPYPVATDAGVITVTGNLGTNLVFDLATTPDAISFINRGKTIVIDPGIVFPVGETVTVSWSGLVDASCGAPIVSPTWTFDIGGAPCTPGQNGMVGSSVTRMPTGAPTFTEYYVVADANPNGYVYFGGDAALYRMPKAGGAIEDIEAVAGLTAGMLGQEMFIAGNEIYLIENTTSAVTSNLLWRISTDGGATWNVENYMQLPQPANDNIVASDYFDGRIYLATHESTNGTEIWSVAAGATTLPQMAQLEALIPDEDADTCSGLAVDSVYYYLACSGGDRLIRVHRTTLNTELISDSINFSATNNALYAHDIDGNGRADVLYVGRDSEDVRYVCDPSGLGPFFADVLAGWGSSTATTNYGLGFDPVAGVLWTIDDANRDLLEIE